MLHGNRLFENSMHMFRALSAFVLFMLLGYPSAARIKQLVIPTDTSAFQGSSIDPNESVPEPKVTVLPDGKFRIIFPASRGPKYVCNFDGASPNSSSKVCPEQVVLKGTNVVKIVGLVNNNVVTKTRAVLLFDSTYRKLGQGRLVMNIPSIAGVVSVFQFDNVTDVVLNNRLVARYDYNIGFDFLASSDLVRDKYQMLAFSPNMGGNACNTWGVNVLSVDDHQAVNSSIVPSCGSTDIQVKAVQEGQLRVSFSGGRIPSIIFLCDPERISLLSGSNDDMKGIIASDTIYKVSDVAKANAAGETRFLDLEKPGADPTRSAEGILVGGDSALGTTSQGENGMSEKNDTKRVIAAKENPDTASRNDDGKGQASVQSENEFANASPVTKYIYHLEQKRKREMAEDTTSTRPIDSLQRVINGFQKVIQYICDGYMPKIGTYWKIAVSITVSPSGKVVDGGVIGSNTENQNIDDEIASRARRLTFCKIARGGNQTIKFTSVYEKKSRND